MIKLINIFNRVNYWVAHTVRAIFKRTIGLTKKLEKELRRVVNRFIIIAQNLMSLNNYHLALAVISGLHNQSITRIKFLWKNRKLLNKLKSMEQTMDNTKNYAYYRRVLDGIIKFKQFSIPYMGIFISDIQHALENDILDGSGRNINQNTFDCIATIVSKFIRLRHISKSTYTLPNGKLKVTSFPIPCKNPGNENNSEKLWNESQRLLKEYEESKVKKPKKSKKASKSKSPVATSRTGVTNKSVTNKSVLRKSKSATIDSSYVDIDVENTGKNTLTNARTSYDRNSLRGRSNSARGVLWADQVQSPDNHRKRRSLNMVFGEELDNYDSQRRYGSTGRIRTRPRSVSMADEYDYDISESDEEFEDYPSSNDYQTSGYYSSPNVASGRRLVRSNSYVDKKKIIPKQAPDARNRSTSLSHVVAPKYDTDRPQRRKNRLTPNDKFHRNISSIGDIISSQRELISYKLWDENQVGEWLDSIGLSSLKENFVREQITGEVLPDILDMDIDDISDLMGIKVGAYLKLRREIQRLND
jgi:hypothetical protein